MLISSSAHDRNEILDIKDDFQRRTAAAELIHSFGRTDRSLLEKLLFDRDNIVSGIALAALKKLVPCPSTLGSAWENLFGESVELLARRASGGPVSIRMAAARTLAFCPNGVSTELARSIISAASDDGSADWIVSPPALPLIQGAAGNGRTESITLLLVAMNEGIDRKDILNSMLSSGNPEKLLPALSFLSLFPGDEFTEALLPLVRSNDPSTALQAARALLRCGGKRVFVLLLSLLAETADPEKKAGLIPLIASTGREPAWSAIIAHLKAENPLVRLASVKAAQEFPVPAAGKATALEPLLKDSDPGVLAETARIMWGLGSLSSVSILEKMVNSLNPAVRKHGVSALADLPAELSFSPLIAAFSRERSGDALRASILGLRQRLSKITPSRELFDRISDALRKRLEATDPFIRSQTAVLCGAFGTSAEELLIEKLHQQEHPYVLAAMLSALARMGSSRLLVTARFHQHPDPRVRAAFIESALNSGFDAIPYLSAGLEDQSTRVRTVAARNLFLLGQFDVIGILNRMLLVPSHGSVVSACHALGSIMRMHPPILKGDHPVPLALGRMISHSVDSLKNQSCSYSLSLLVQLFRDLTIAGGDLSRISFILKNYVKKQPAAYHPRRMLASILSILEDFKGGLRELEICISNRPGIMADLLDAYRLSMLLSDFQRGKKYGKLASGMYRNLHAECLRISAKVRGRGSESFTEKLHSLTNPSLNIYNAMIQLKSLQGEKEVVTELMSELLLSRPTNLLIARKLATVVSESHRDLAEALNLYADSFSKQPEN